jgi:hypothetical protein
LTRQGGSVQPDDSLGFVLSVIHVGGYRHVPFVDKQERPLAVISVKVIIAFIVGRFVEDVLDLPPSPVRKRSQQEEA